MAEGRHHYSELLQILNDFAVEYLIVGGYAVMHYSELRGFGERLLIRSQGV